MAKTTYLLLAALAAYARAGEHVLALTDANFDDEMENIGVTIVKFYAPWCGHCKRMAPEYEKAAKTLKENDPPVPLVDVDCTVEKAVCQKYDVSGYPTLKVFRNGVKTNDYSGGREAADFVKFLAGQAGPAASETNDVDKYESLVNGKKHVVFGFFDDANADGYKAFQKAADELRETVKFTYTFNADVLKAAGKESGSIALYRPKVMKSKFEEQVVDYDKGKYTIGLVRNWVLEGVRGLAPILAGDKQDDAGYPQIMCAYNVDYERDPKGTQYWRNRIMKVAQKFTGKHLNFVVGNHQEWGQQLTEANIKTDGKIPVCVAYDDKATKYMMTAEFNMDTFEAFINDYQGGKLEAHIKSQDVENEEGAANIVLTAKNYKKHVDGTKDTFIKFYAPWCGHCKSLAPKWIEMAEEFKDDDSVVISDFDADSNDLPAGFEVKGFPTLYWMPAGKAPVKYQGGRETADLIQYVKDNRSNVKEEL
jgi:protein disulfide isomerase family A protein 3